jgi:hypothetical protein
MPDLETAKPATPPGRPFPWFCPRCRRKEVRPATIPYRCVRSRQGREYTVDIPALVVPQCGNCKEMVFNYNTEEQIANALQTLVEETGAGQGGGETDVFPCRAGQGNGSDSAAAPEALSRSEKGSGVV